MSAAPLPVFTPVPVPEPAPVTVADNVIRLAANLRVLPPPSKLRTRPSAPPLVAFPRWETARDQVVAALSRGTSQILVSGPAGTGKTLLLDSVAKILRVSGRPVVQVLAGMTHTVEPGEILLVDEADRLSPSALDALLARRDGPVVLAGLGALDERVPADATRVALTVLERQEARDFIAQWLELSGRTPSALTAAAMLRIVTLSGGVPRLLSVLLGASVWLAEAEGQATIQPEHVDEASALRTCAASPAPAEAPPIPCAKPVTRRSPLLLLSGCTTLAAMAAVVALVVGVGPAALDRSATEMRLEVLTWPDAIRAFVTSRMIPSGARVAWQAPISAAIPVPDMVDAAPAPVVQIAAASDVAVAPRGDLPLALAAPSPEPEAPEQPVDKAAGMAPDTVRMLLQRGRTMMALGDVSAARLLLTRAAEAGDAEAMLALGRTYDPAVLGSALRGDVAEARRWYQRAAEMGEREARALTMN